MRYVAIKLIESLALGTLFFLLSSERSLWDWEWSVVCSVAAAFGVDYLYGEIG